MASFDWINQDIFYKTALDERSTVTDDYINVWVQLVVTTEEIQIQSNNKSYVTKDIKRTINVRNMAYERDKGTQTDIYGEKRLK